MLELKELESFSVYIYALLSPIQLCKDCLFIRTDLQSHVTNCRPISFPVGYLGVKIDLIPKFCSSATNFYKSAQFSSAQSFSLSNWDKSA